LIASVLQGQIRRVDTVALVGGDAFALLLPGTGRELAQRVLSDLKGRVLEGMEQTGWPVTVSISAVTFTRPPGSVDEVIRIADQLMYTAKRGGKNTIRCVEFTGTSR
jgi:diguanylate cyclase (GGDEF)-like protein